jgi:8-amino-7-oxononanoate synthase
MSHIPDSIRDKLAKRKSDDAFRELLVLDGLVDFCSNDYLGVSQIVSNQELGAGSTGSRLISGNSKELENIEKFLSDFFKQEASLMYNSGYDANLGFFSCIPQREDTVIYDELCHASIRDGIKLGNANSFSFKHNNPENLREKLSRVEGVAYVVVESIYSMDGDQCPLIEIARICEEVGAFLVVDEAHSGGLYGEGGNGLVSEMNLDETVLAKIVTFGKAYGSHGAIICCAKEIKDYLINFSRSLIYTTALSPHAQGRILQVVKLVSDMNGERNTLKKNIKLFRNQLADCMFELMESESAIQGIIVPGNKEVKLMASKLLDAGFAVKAILYPTVSKGKERIRICIHSYNSEEEINELTSILNG